MSNQPAAPDPNEFSTTFAASFAAQVAEETNKTVAPPPSRQELEVMILAALNAMPTYQNKTVLQRVVRAILRIAARIELTLGYSPDDYMTLAMHAMQSVLREAHTKKSSNNPNESA